MSIVIGKKRLLGLMQGTCDRYRVIPGVQALQVALYRQVLIPIFHLRENQTLYKTCNHFGLLVQMNSGKHSRAGMEFIEHEPNFLVFWPLNQAFVSFLSHSHPYSVPNAMVFFFRQIKKRECEFLKVKTTLSNVCFELEERSTVFYQFRTPSIV